MTKIYLVYFEGYDAAFKSSRKILFNVFTNRKKAKIYAEYKQLQTETEKPDYLKNYEDITYKVEEWTITQLDYKKELVELQQKNLPF